MIIKQVKLGWMAVFCYIAGCEKTKEAIVIDPGGDADPIFAEARRAGLAVKYIVCTHNHGDHTSGMDRLKELTGAKTVMHKLDAGQFRDIDIQPDGDSTLEVGNINFKIYHTPGHTEGGICLFAEGNIFTGDTLFVGDSGRTDLPGGHRATLGKSIRKVMKLPNTTVVWPGHDYGITPSSTLGWEKKNNVNAREYGFSAG